MSMIDRDSPIPAYHQIQIDLKERIMRGDWDATGQLPSESKLAELYEVSRITLRQALAELEKDGLIKKSRGRSAEICKHPVPFIHKLDYSLVSAHHSRSAYNVTADVLTLQRFDVPYKEIAESLQIAADSPVVYLKRLFSLEGKPVAIGRSWLSLERFPGLDVMGLDENNRLSATLSSRYHVRATRVEDSVEAVRPTPSECKVLDISYDCPLLSVSGISYDGDNCPVEYSTTLWLGDKVRFKITMQTADPDQQD